MFKDPAVSWTWFKESFSFLSMFEDSCIACLRRMLRFVPLRWRPIKGQEMRISRVGLWLLIQKHQYQLHYTSTYTNRLVLWLFAALARDMCSSLAWAMTSIDEPKVETSISALLVFHHPATLLLHFPSLPTFLNWGNCIEYCAVFCSLGISWLRSSLSSVPPVPRIFNCIRSYCLHLQIGWTGFQRKAKYNRITTHNRRGWPQSISCSLHHNLQLMQY